jgi:4-amino-4-deoxy-L-arabinose transferase-like glycosyltransferase
MRRAAIPLLLGAALLFAWNVWGYSLWAPDEPFFGEGAREMLVDGHWAVVHVNGEINTHKPPLFFWLIALLSVPFGEVTSLTARLPSILAALGTLVLTMRLGLRIAGRRAALLACAVLATNYMFWDKARSAQIDSLLCFLIMVAVTAFEAHRAGDASGRGAGLLFWLACALACLAKGPVGLLLPLGIAIITLALDRNIGAWRRFAPMTGPLLFALIIAAWAIPAYFISGGEYSMLSALNEHFTGRAIHGMHHAQPPWYYLKVMPLHLMPWSFLVPGALLLAWRRRTPGERLLLVIALFVVLFFSISTEKRDLYVLPAYPAYALLVAMLIEHCTSRGEGRSEIGRRWLSIPQALTSGILFSAGLAALLKGGEIAPVPYPIVLTIAIGLMLTAAVTLGALLAKRTMLYCLAPAAGLAVLYIYTAGVLFPAIEPLKSTRPFALEIKKITADHRAGGGRVLAFDIRNIPKGVSFYSDGVYLIEAASLDELATLLGEERYRYAVVRQQHVEELPEELGRRIEVRASARLSRLDAVLISVEPLP